MIRDIVSSRSIIVYLFAFFFSTYLFTASGINVKIGDCTIMRLAVAKSIVERSDISVSAPVEISIKGFDGREYSLFGIGSVLLVIPFYAFSKLVGIPPENVIFTINQMVGATTAVVVFLFCMSLGYTRRASVYVSICYGLGTYAWYYAKDSGDHAIETLFSLLSVYFMHRYSASRKISYILLSAAALGFAFLTRPTSLLIIPSLMMLMVLPHRAILPIKATVKSSLENTLLFISLLLPFAALSFWYNYSRFGSIFETGYTFMAARLGLDFFSGTPLVTGLSGLLASPGKGYFYYSPIAFLFFFSLRPFRKEHPATAVSFICLIISYLLFISKNIYWHGDWAWGPRYIFVITPFLIIPLAALFDSPAWDNIHLFRKSVYALFALSLGIQLLSISVHNYNYFEYLQNEKVIFTVARGDGAPVITEPQIDTYFDFRYAPILVQPKLIFSAGKNLIAFIYNKDTQHARFNIRSQPWLNSFDFWWIYIYFLGNSFSGIIVAIALFLVSVISASKLRNAIYM